MFKHNLDTLQLKRVNQTSVHDPDLATTKPEIQELFCILLAAGYLQPIL